MESLVKRYFWLVNLLLLTGLAFLSAKVVNNLIAEKIVSIEVSSAQAKKRAAVETEPAYDREEWETIISERNIFNSEPPEPVEEITAESVASDEPVEVDPTQIPGPDEACEPSDAPLQLVATMEAEPAQWSLAVVEENSLQRLIRIGQELDRRELVAIQRTRLVLFAGGKFECVDLGKKGSSRRPSIRSASSSKSSSSPRSKSSSDKIKEGVKKTGKNTYQIDRDMLNEQLEDLGNLSRQARVIPHYRQGKPQGFKIVGVRPGSLYSHIGVRSGDVLKSVNGDEISSPTKALELYEKLKNSDGVTLDIERRGRKTTLEYLIK